MTIPLRPTMNFLMRVMVLEKKTRNQLIAMDEVSGLADESKKCASCLTVARKFNYTCVYIFHIIYQENQIGEQFFPKLTFLMFFQLSSP